MERGENRTITTPLHHMPPSRHRTHAPSSWLNAPAPGRMVQRALSPLDHAAQELATEALVPSGLDHEKLYEQETGMVSAAAGLTASLRSPPGPVRIR